MVLRGSLIMGFIVILLGLCFVVPTATALSWNTLFDLDNDDVSVEDDDDNELEEDDHPVLAERMVRIDGEINAYTGIEVLSLAESSFSPEWQASATVITLKSLLELKTRFNQALAALNMARVARTTAEQEVKRLNLLSQGAGSVASKNVSYAKSALNGAKAHVQALNYNVQAIRDEALQQWGEKISGWVLANGGKEWQRLLSHQDSLLLVSLPVDLSLPAETNIIRISRNGSRSHARKAYYVSSARLTDTVMQGETYFFKTATGKLRSGMRLDVWFAQDEQPVEGVFVPDQAILWHDGEPWAYVQLDDELYQRKPLKSALEAAGGLFARDEFNAGDSLVIRGAQMLLSEEFRWQILDEDDD